MRTRSPSHTYRNPPPVQTLALAVLALVLLAACGSPHPDPTKTAGNAANDAAGTASTDTATPPPADAHATASSAQSATASNVEATPSPTPTSNTGTETATAITPTTPDASPTPTCPPRNSGVSISFFAYQSIEHLIWASETIVHGTVTEVLPSTYEPDPDADNAHDCNSGTIYTDYVVQVHATYRGYPTQSGTLLVRRLGGIANNRSLENSSEPTLDVGDEAVFFLNSEDGPYPKHWAITGGGHQGRRDVVDGQVQQPFTADNIAPKPLSELISLIATTLQAQMPDHLPSVTLLSEAPLGPDLFQ